MEHFNHDVFRGPRLTLPVLVIALCVLFATAVPGRAATSITFCPFIIATPGNYELATDLACPAYGILINASGVSLKLNGHTITGPGNDRGIQVFPSSGRLDHVTIQGPGLIRNFAFGISVFQTDYAQVALVTSARNGEGLVTNDCNYLTVGSSAFVGNDIGVAFQGSNSVFQYNDLSGNGDGILAIGAATVNNNTANGNRAAGISVAGNNSRVFANVTNGNGTVGIYVTTPTSGNQIFNNTSSVGNGTFDLEDDNAKCGSTLWNNNVFFTRSQPCIR